MYIAIKIIFKGLISRKTHAVELLSAEDV